MDWSLGKAPRDLHRNQGLLCAHSWISHHAPRERHPPVLWVSLKTHRGLFLRGLSKYMSVKQGVCVFVCVPTGWRAAHAGGRQQQPAGPPRWCTGSSSTRSPSPEPTWCLRSPVKETWWCIHTKTAAARSRTAPGAGCDYARAQPHTAGKRRSQRPSTSSQPPVRATPRPPRCSPREASSTRPADCLRHGGGVAAVPPENQEE